MKFLRNLLAAIIGCLVAFGIIFIMFFVFAALFGNAEDTVTIDKGSVLELQLKKPIMDYVGANEADPFSVLFQENQGLDEIIHAIKVAKTDDRIQGISIKNNFALAGMAQMKAIRNALEDFKTSGKFIYAFGDIYMQKDYYLASVADKMYVNIVGGVDFKGLSSEVLFFKDLQEKTGVTMEVIRHGKYKSAVEPFLSNTMSDANRTQIQELLESLWGSVVEDISESRGISPENLNIIADTLGARTTKYASDIGVIDGALHFDEYEVKLKEVVGVSEEDDLSYIDIDKYIQSSNKKKINSGKDKIAVIYAQGEIIYGKGGPNVIGQDIIIEALTKAREKETVKAIVLRVDSPGGSALTSDIIWREVELTKKIKPVIVSMGNLAASGGYYISAGANKIFAEPTTITGSIGVFGVIPNLTELSKDIGINAEQVGTNKNSVDYSVFEPMTNTFRGNMQEGIEEIYHTFLSRVSNGRGISMEEADAIAQGRVWSGIDAKKIGLVDELGGLDDAIAAAAEMVGLDAYGIKKYPKYKTGLEKIMEDLGGASSRLKTKAIKEEIGVEAYTILKEVQSAMKQKGIQARMPFALDIK